MKNTIFYHLLDRELPRVIDEATTLLGLESTTDSSILNNARRLISTETQAQLSSDGRSSKVAVGYFTRERKGQFSRTSRLDRLNELRRVLGQLSTAYAISEYESFANFAIRLTQEEIIGTNLITLEEWDTTYSFEDCGKDGIDFRLSMVEVVLSLELLRGMGRLEGELLDQLRDIFEKRLSKNRDIDYEALTVDEQFAWFLEMVVLALFLHRREIFNEMSSRFHRSLTVSLHQLFESYDHSRSSSRTTSDLIFCADCYFAVAHWLELHSGSVWKTVNTEFERLRELLGSDPFEEIRRGAWVLAKPCPLSEALLRGSSVFLISGETLDRPELIDCWLEGDYSSAAKKENKYCVMTQPLLWFGAEEWAYPFSRFACSRRPYIGRI